MMRGDHAVVARVAPEAGDASALLRAKLGLVPGGLLIALGIRRSRPAAPAERNRSESGEGKSDERGGEA